MKEEQLHNTEGGEEEGDEAAVEAMEQLGEDICHTEETVSLEGETHPVEGVEDKGEVEPERGTSWWSAFTELILKNGKTCSKLVTWYSTPEYYNWINYT